MPARTDHRSRARRRTLLGGGAATALIAASVVLFVVGLRSDEPPGVPLAETARLAGIDLDVAEAEGDGVVTSIEELHAAYGEPPDANFGRMLIPALGVDAPLGTRYVGTDGTMAEPTGPDDVVYYDFSGWDSYGGFPTAGGNAVFAGHVDRAAYLEYAGVNYIGPGVFYSLSSLGGGEEIVIDLGTGPVTYIVEWIREVHRGADWQEILGSSVEVDSITLITCGGEFNHVEQSYTHRTVVRAVRA